MQTVETLNEGLKRAYTLTIPAADIEARVSAEVRRVAPQVKMPGFRPGKVPANLVRKMHGESLMQDALEWSVQQGVQSVIQGHKLRPAMQPSIELAEGYATGQDAEVKISLEVLPEVPTPALDGLKLERLIVPVAEEAVDEQIRKFADAQKRWSDADEGHAAAMGDQVVVDFLGKTADGVAFEGGTGTDMAVELGAGRLIPGFEDQLVGASVGEAKVLNVTFPADYPVKELAGQPATFDITVKAVKTAGEAAIDEELAKNLGLESLEQMRGLLRGQIEEEHNGLTRTHMKRKLLDQLAEGHDFDVPPSMVDAEFDQIWRQLEHETTHEADPAAARAEMESERDDYRRIAERRVRLGLLLSEIGQANGVEVTQQEMSRLIMQAAQQYPAEQRQQFMQYVQQEPMAAAQLRAPLYEDKVVDFLFGKAEVTERETTREELEAAIESEDGFATGTHVHNHDHGHEHDHDHDHDHAQDGEAAASAVTEADASAETATEEAKSAKKPRAKKAGAPIETETALVESSPEAAEAAEGTGSPDAAAPPAPPKKPRAKKAKTESEA